MKTKCLLFAWGMMVAMTMHAQQLKIQRNAVNDLKNGHYSMKKTMILDKSFNGTVIENATFDGCGEALAIDRKASKGNLMVWERMPSAQSDYPMLVVNGKGRDMMAFSVETKVHLSREKKEHVLYGEGNQTFSLSFGKLNSSQRKWLTKMDKGSFVTIQALWLSYRFSVVSRQGKGQKTVLTLTSQGPVSDELINTHAMRVELINPHVKDKEILPGTYICHKGQIRYRKTGDDGGQMTAREAVAGTLIELNNCENVVFRNVKFCNNGISGKRDQGIIHDFTLNSGRQAEALTIPCVAISRCKNVTFENCEFTDIMGYCISTGPLVNAHEEYCTRDVMNGERRLAENPQAYSNGVQIVGNYVHDTYGGGFQLNLCNQSKVENNLIKNIGTVQQGTVGILIRHGSNNVITHNTVYKGPYTGISVGWTWDYIPSFCKNNTVSYNHIHHCMQEKSDDGAGIYTLGYSDGTVIEKNIIHHINAHDGKTAYAVYFDCTTSDIQFRQNVCYDCDCFLHHHYGKDNKVHNNIFANNTAHAFFLSIGEKHRSFTASNNIIRMGNVKWMEKAKGANCLFCNNLIDEGNDIGLTEGRIPKNNIKGEIELAHFGSTGTMLQGRLGTYKMLPLGGIPLDINGFKVFGEKSDFPMFDILQHPEQVGVTTKELLQYDIPEEDLK